MSPRASVVVPVFNGMPHLRTLTDSLLAQTQEDLEIVFSEGGSRDDSAAYLQSLDDPRVKVISVPPGTSAAENWTAVSAAATGEFVKLACQDDLLYPDAIAKQVIDLQQNPRAVMAIAQRDIIDANGRILYPRRGCAGLATGPTPGADVVRMCYTRGTNVFGEPVAVMFRREPLIDALPWNDVNPFVLDLELYTRVAPLGDVIVRKESIGGFRVNSGSWSTRLVSQQVRQYEQWQDAYVTSLSERPSTPERLRAKSGLHGQALLRRGAYRWLALKGSMRTAD